MKADRRDPLVVLRLSLAAEIGQDPDLRRFELPPDLHGETEPVENMRPFEKERFLGLPFVVRKNTVFLSTGYDSDLRVDGGFPMETRGSLCLRGLRPTDQTTANQERELREVAQRAGWQVVKVYKDHGISGAKGRDKRPAFDALCRDASARQFDVVMAWSVDRLAAVCKTWSLSFPTCTP